MEGIIWVILIGAVIIVIAINSSTHVPLVTSQFIYGVAVHPRHYESSDTGLQKLQELGVSMAREDVGWSGVETTKGVYNFVSHDNRVDRLLSVNVTPLLILTYSNFLYSNMPSGMGYDGSLYVPPIGSPEWANYKLAWGEFIYQSVKHFSEKYDLIYYELWNEPYGFWQPSTTPLDIKAIQYTELLKEGYKRAKEANPNSKILIGGLAVGRTVADTFIGTIYQYGGKDYFDIMNIHPYCSYSYQAGKPNELQGTGCTTLNGDIIYLKSVMDSYGDGNKKWWITEFGYPSEGCYISQGKEGSVASVSGCDTLSETFQNYRMINAMNDIKKYNFITAFFWYDFKDDCLNRKLWSGGEIPGCVPDVVSLGCPVWIECRFGLLHYDYSNKSAFSTYQEIIKNE